MNRRLTIVVLTAVLLVFVGVDLLHAQGGPGRGRGPGFGPGRGRGFQGGRGGDKSFAEDHEVFFFLLQSGDKIKRTITNLENGVETLTESDDADVAAKIQEHVAAMYSRVDERRPIHMRDPLFREIFSHADKIVMKSEETDKGVRVTETSDDPYVAKLVQEHAKVVSLFVKNGHAELPKNHAVPKR
ncbi:MAG: hypothetical protein KDA41_01500 [Planctomycetales bacterium]|nr:hypothetical protein [Planctomycetales bacterium]